MNKDKLHDLAHHCNNGACNVQGLLRGLALALFPDTQALGSIHQECADGKAKDSVALKIILGQLSFLIGESLGPTSEALDAWNKLNQETP